MIIVSRQGEAGRRREDKWGWPGTPGSRDKWGPMTQKGGGNPPSVMQMGLRPGDQILEMRVPLPQAIPPPPPLPHGPV